MFLRFDNSNIINYIIEYYMATYVRGILFGLFGTAIADTLIWEDQFDKLDFSKWQHEITMGGGGNWEFEWYTNNRTNSFV